MKYTELLNVLDILMTLFDDYFRIWILIDWISGNRHGAFPIHHLVLICPQASIAIHLDLVGLVDLYGLVRAQYGRLEVIEQRCCATCGGVTMWWGHGWACRQRQWAQGKRFTLIGYAHQRWIIMTFWAYKYIDSF